MKNKFKSTKKSHAILAKELPDVAVTTFAKLNNFNHVKVIKKNTTVKASLKSATAPQAQHLLERVGMYGVETMVKLQEGETANHSLPAKIDIAVNLISPTARGIHMSRLYHIVFRELPNKPLSPSLMKKVLKEMVSSQAGISNFATLKLSTNLTLKRSALISDNYGFRHYPIEWKAHYDAVKKQFFFSCTLKLLYSSTCPCSTALSVDLQEKEQGKLFTEFVGTPHAQRSEADVTIIYRNLPDGKFMSNLIDQLEGVIATPVQTAVKREDEQEFARLNAEHLMFCEDAVRALKMALEKNRNIADYRIQVSHFESLHAHDAVAVSVKGVSGGLEP